jgi:hypothetical protein
VYHWQTRNHPDFSTFRDWYGSGAKVFPEDIRLTPTVLKHWYVCDGNLAKSESYPYIRIGISNEKDNKEKIEGYFENAGLPRPQWYTKGETGHQLSFTVEESLEIFDYIGGPLPGFEYKWVR